MHRQAADGPDPVHGLWRPQPPGATYDALIFDWDGTAVTDRAADATELRRRVERLSGAGVHLFVVTGTHMENIDDQLGARPVGPGRLLLCCNRGSEVFEVGSSGPVLLARRSATPAENDALDEAAATTVSMLASQGLEARVVAERLNRRKIDLIPTPEWADPPKARITELAEAVHRRLAATGVTSLADVIAVALDAACRAGLDDARVTSDVKHVEIGLTDKSESARFAAHWLARRGITGALVLVGGDEFGPVGGARGSDSLMLVDELRRSPAVSVGAEPEGVPGPVVHLGGGPARFAAILDDQLERRAHGRVPQIDPDPGWTVVLPGEARSRRVAESLGALSNGWLGVRADLEEDGPDAEPLVLAAGCYTPAGHLLAAPVWTEIDRLGAPDVPANRVLDLRSGVLARSDPTGTVRSVRFVSAAEPAAMALRAEAGPHDLVPGSPLRLPAAGSGGGLDRHNHVVTATERAGAQQIAVAARQHDHRADGVHVLERLAAWAAGSDDVGAAARGALRALGTKGYDAALAEHRREWARRWRDAEVRIEGDHDAQLAARFAVFHLLSAAADEGEAAVGARGLTGNAYAGHVFWDADVFVLPVLAAIRPAAARAMLEYRLRRLPEARAAAAALGRRGARFPWESADDGRDVTPRSVRGIDGRPVPIATGPHEEHIVADVAWAADRYVCWSGDEAFLGPGADLLLDTARYWSSRIRTDTSGRGHIYGIMGPDEYHEVVDDNAFTNVMARWNLRVAATLLERGGPTGESARWRTLAESLVDGWDPRRRLYEQFAGYFDLEPLLVSEVAERPVAADVLLGADRVARSQVIKQADVLMAHHLVPQEMRPRSLEPCLRFYEPRTAHGSSLSPAVHASLLARAGHPERALALFRVAARLDLDDVTGTTAGGLHLATMGGLWQALAYGFLGLSIEGETLVADPHLPRAWKAVELTMRVRGRRLTVRAEHGRVLVAGGEGLTIRIGGGRPVEIGPHGFEAPIRRPSPTGRSVR